MIFLCNAEGTVTQLAPSNIYQGSNYANEIVLIAPFGISAKVHITTSSGIVLEPIVMETLFNDAEMTKCCIFRTLVDESITEQFGFVKISFSLYWQGEEKLQTVMNTGQVLTEILPGPTLNEIDKDSDLKMSDIINIYNSLKSVVTSANDDANSASASAQEALASMLSAANDSGDASASNLRASLAMEKAKDIVKNFNISVNEYGKLIISYLIDNEIKETTISLLPKVSTADFYEEDSKRYILFEFEDKSIGKDGVISVPIDELFDAKVKIFDDKIKSFFDNLNVNFDDKLAQKQDKLPENNSASSHTLVLQSPFGRNDENGNYIYGFQISKEKYNELKERFPDCVEEKEGKYYWTEQWQLKRIGGYDGDTKDSSNGITGVITRGNRDAKLAKGLISQYGYNNYIDHHEPNNLSIVCRDSDGRIVVEDGEQPFHAVNKRQLDEKMGSVEKSLEEQKEKNNRVDAELNTHRNEIESFKLEQVSMNDKISLNSSDIESISTRLYAYEGRELARIDFEGIGNDVDVRGFPAVAIKRLGGITAKNVDNEEFEDVVPVCIDVINEKGSFTSRISIKDIVEFLNNNNLGFGQGMKSIQKYNYIDFEEKIYHRHVCHQRFDDETKWVAVPTQNGKWRYCASLNCTSIHHFAGGGTNPYAKSTIECISQEYEYTDVMQNFKETKGFSIGSDSIFVYDERYASEPYEYGFQQHMRFYPIDIVYEIDEEQISLSDIKIPILSVPFKHKVCFALHGTKPNSEYLNTDVYYHIFSYNKPKE